MSTQFSYIFMVRRDIPMIAFPRVRCMIVYMFVATYTSMRCIRSQGSYVIQGARSINGRGA